MNRGNHGLRAEVSALFERACREQDFLVADYLLQALEAIAQRDGDEAPVLYAYQELARLPQERRSS